MDLNRKDFSASTAEIITCDQAFFFRRNAKVLERESGGRERREKRTPDTITARVVCRPCLISCRHNRSQPCFDLVNRGLHHHMRFKTLKI